MLDFDGVQALDVTGPIEVFTSANDFGGRYRLELVSADGRDVIVREPVQRER